MCLEQVQPVEGRVCSICGERVLSAEANADGVRPCPVCRQFGREVLLMDDVHATGTTVWECYGVPRKAATQVWVATVARTLKVASKYAETGPEEDASGELSERETPLARAVGE